MLLPLITDGTGLWNPNGPLQRLDTDDGSDAWSGARVIEIDPAVPPQFYGDTLVAVAGDHLVVVDAQSGGVIFTAAITDTGRSFTVRLRRFDDHLAYIGEFVVAGVDMESGDVVFRHGLTPISAETSLNALDFSIPRLQEQMGAVGSDGASFSLGETQRFQNMAPKLRRVESFLMAVPARLP